MHRAVRLIAVAALVVAAAGSTACGGGPSPAEILAASPGKTIEARSARMVVDVDVTGGPEPVRLGGEGAFDLQTQRGRLDFDMSSLGLPGATGKAEMIMAGDVVYMKLPLATSQLQARPWLKLDLAAVARQSGIDLESLKRLRNNDPTGSLNFLRGVSDDVEEVGSEEVRGTETTHYTATVDLDKAAQQAPPEVRDDVQQTAQQLGTDKLPVEVWVDDDGRIRRERFSVDLSKVTTPQGAGTPGGGTLTTTVELFDFGASVDATEPPPHQVTDFMTLLNQMQQPRARKQAA